MWVDPNSRWYKASLCVLSEGAPAKNSFSADFTEEDAVVFQ